MPRRGSCSTGFRGPWRRLRRSTRSWSERNNGPLVIVDVMVPEQELVRRLGGRRICGACGTNADPRRRRTCGKCGGELVQRADDDQGVVRERLKVYQHTTKPVLEFYRERPTFRVVNGAQAPERVARELDTMIDDAAQSAMSAERAR